jgi:multiple sugar transport system permease protein
MSIAELRRVTTRRTKGASRAEARADERDRRDDKAALIFLLPWLVGLSVLTLGPMLVSLYLSFTDYNLLQAAHFTGLDNVVHMVHDARLHQSLKVTFTYVIFGVPLQLAVALGLALLLDRGMRGLAFYRSALYLPSLLGGSVAIAVLWRTIFGDEGLVDDVLGIFGVASRSWVGDPDTALGTVILLHVWTFGSPLVIFLTDPGKYTVPVALRSFIDAQANSSYGSLFAMSTLSLVPVLLAFTFGQRYLIRGIATTGGK